MSLQFQGYIDLPEHRQPGGFDHAAFHTATGRIYVAHTVNDAIDVINCRTDRYLHSIPELKGVAGALVSDEQNLVFTSNRGENTIGIFAPENEQALVKVGVGIRPNGLAYDAKHQLLLAANVGDPAIADSFTLSMVDVQKKTMIASVPVPGRTRWAIFNPNTNRFYVNISDPALIVAIDANQLSKVAQSFPIPATGPHGLDLDLENQWLFCACDGKKLLRLEAASGTVTHGADLSGSPDVIFFNAQRQHLYVAIGDPGVIDVFDTRTMERIQTLPTEQGAHTIALQNNKVYAFLPQTHRASIYEDCSQSSMSALK